jgi:hypothetical protein
MRSSLLCFGYQKSWLQDERVYVRAAISLFGIEEVYDGGNRALTHPVRLFSTPTVISKMIPPKDTNA